MLSYTRTNTLLQALLERERDKLQNSVVLTPERKLMYNKYNINNNKTRPGKWDVEHLTLNN